MLHASEYKASVMRLLLLKGCALAAETGYSETFLPQKYGVVVITQQGMMTLCNGCLGACHLSPGYCSLLDCM